MILLLKSKFKWEELAHPIHEVVKSGLHPEIERLFLVRGLGSVDDLKPNSKAKDVWNDPYAFKEMKIAVERIKKAIQNHESILIYGDYDADGITSTVILIKTLRRMGANVDFYIPHRMLEGYGPNEDAFLQIVGEGHRLVITVDCGITAVAEAKILKTHGVDLIIIDHHQPKAEIPVAVAIIHPEYDENYPFNFLAGAGVVLKVVEALKEGKLETDDFMLAMLGTVGDVVDLVNENRTIVKRGLIEMQKTSLLGMRALLNACDVQPHEMDETKVGFVICPRLNAPGRMNDASIVVDLLLAEDEFMATEYASEIEEMNNKRKLITEDIIEEAIEIAENSSAQHAMVLYQPHWHEGVLGIVASKMVEKYGKAVVILTANDEGLLKGSARAPNGFNILNALIANERHLLKYGGHEFAAGLTLATEDPEPLEIGLNEALKNSEMTRSIVVDSVLSVKDLDLLWLTGLERLAPFGQGNQRPIIKLTNVNIRNIKRIGATHQHLKFTIQEGKQNLDAIFFHGAPVFIYLTAIARFDILCEIELNEWNGNKKLQARIIDIKCDEPQLFDLRNQRLDAEFSQLIDDAFVIEGSYDSKEGLKSAFISSGKPNLILKPLGTLTMPTRAQFVFVYKTVKKYAPFLLTTEIVTYYENNRISKAMLIFIIRVFSEIGLLKVEDALVTERKTSEKLDYTLAPSFMSRKAKVAVHEFLELATADEILNYVFGDE